MDSAAARAKEFQQFGPWIDEVTGYDDVPPLFRAHPIEFSAARLVLKVPRSITRRDVTAGMDLYDHLLVLMPHELTVLSRDTTGDGVAQRGPGRYAVRVLPLADLAAVRDSVSLLSASLTLHGRDGGEVSIGYNGSARASITRLVGELVDAMGPGEPRRFGLRLTSPDPHAMAVTDLVQIPGDTALVAALRDVSRGREHVVPLAWHGRQGLRASGAGFRSLTRRLADSFSPPTLNGAILLADARTVGIVGRHEWIARGTAPEFTTSYLVLALDALADVALTLHSVYPDAVVATFELDRARIAVVIPYESEMYRRLWNASTGRV